MSVLLTVAFATVTQFQPTCSWDNPGANPYRGSTSAAIERYQDIPEQVRRTLIRRMKERQSDDQVSITRDAIVGKHLYEPAIRDMHFGSASVCTSVTRSKWAEHRQEPAAVYCVGEYCILVPRICGNVSRITRLPASRTAPPAAAPTAPASAQRELTGTLKQRDLGLADATPAEQAEPDDTEQKARERARTRVTEVFDLVQQSADAAPQQASIDGGDERDRDGQFGWHPQWPKDRDDDDYYAPPAPVPEADSWAMLLAGLGVLGAIARRRRK